MVFSSLILLSHRFETILSSLSVNNDIGVLELRLFFIVKVIESLVLLRFRILKSIFFRVPIKSSKNQLISLSVFDFNSFSKSEVDVSSNL